MKRIEPEWSRRVPGKGFVIVEPGLRPDAAARAEKALRKRGRKAKAAFAAANVGFEGWRRSLPPGGIGRVRASAAYALFLGWLTHKKLPAVSQQAFGIRARLAFGATHNRKRATFYLEVGPLTDGPGVAAEIPGEPGELGRAPY